MFQGVPCAVLFLDHKIVKHGFHVFPVFGKVFMPQRRLLLGFLSGQSAGLFLSGQLVDPFYLFLIHWYLILPVRYSGQ